MRKNKKEGWTWTFGSVFWHYIKKGKSLCGTCKHTGCDDLLDEGSPSPEKNCKECMKILANKERLIMKYFVITKDESVKNEMDDWECVPVVEIQRGLFTDAEEAGNIVCKLNVAYNKKYHEDLDPYEVKEINVRKTPKSTKV